MAKYFGHFFYVGVLYKVRTYARKKKGGHLPTLFDYSAAATA